MYEGLSPAGEGNILRVIQFIYDGSKIRTFNMFQLNTQIFSLAHGAIHIASIGDFNLDLLWTIRNFVPKPVYRLFDQAKWIIHLIVVEWFILTWDILLYKNQ